VFEAGNGFDVVGLGKEIDGLGVDEFVVAVFAEHFSVAGKRCGVATDVKNGGW